MPQKDIQIAAWFQSLQEVIHLLTQQAQFRNHLTEALHIMCNCLDADTALFIETTPDAKQKGQFGFHRILEVPAIGSAKEHDIPSPLLGRVFYNQPVKTWVNELLSDSLLPNAACKKLSDNTIEQTIASKLKKNKITKAILNVISIEFSSLLVFPFYQEDVLWGFLTFSSTERIQKTKEAQSFILSCTQILTNLLASQQTESLRVVNQDFLQHKQVKSNQKKDDQPAAVQPELTRHIASTIPDYIFLVDIEKGKVIFSNSDIFLGYNIAQKDNPLEVFATIIHPDDQAMAVLEFILKLKEAKDGEIVSSEYRMRHKKGHWVWISERAKVFRRFADGTAKQYVAIMQDVTDKKNALIQISESEQRYRNFIQYSTEGIFYMNCGKPIATHLSPEEQTEQYYQTAFIQECNLALAKMYDYHSEKQLEGQKVKDIHSRASYQLNRQSFQNFVENNYYLEDTQTIEEVDDGSIRYFLNKRLGIIEKDHLIGIWGVQQDITAKRQAEMALYKSEIRLSEIIKDTKLGLWEWQPEKKTVLLNNNCLQSLGREESTISLPSFLKLIHPDDRQKIKKVIRQFADDFQLNIRFLPKNGQWRWVQINGGKAGVSDNHRTQRYSGTAIDIHKKKTAELLIKESAALLTAILNTLPDTKLRINYQGEILSIYTSLKNQKEIKLADKEKRNLKDILPLFVAKGLLFNARKALDTQHLQTFEFIETQEEGIQYFEARINSINYDEAIIILRNITPLKIAEKALNDQINKYEREKRELEKYIKSNLQLENFAYIASHDLREPLRTMRTFGQFLDRKIGKQLDNDSRKYLDFIINNADRMNQLIEDLLVYSRVNTDPLTREAIDVETLLTSILTNLRTRIDETQAKIIIKDIPKIVYGSPVRIEQVFQNLIANAIKFHQLKTRPFIVITSKETPHYWQFSIQDNGIGIREEFFDRIFAIFKKLHGHHVYQGTGIGLALVKRIVGQHGGEVWLESKEATGSTFHFTLLK